MMNFLKKVFCKKQGVEIKNEENKDLKKWIQFFKSADKKKIENLERTLSKIKHIDSSKARAVQEFLEAGIDQNKVSHAEKIVNDYGQTIMKATELNKIKVKELTNNMNAGPLKSLKKNGANYYHLQNKFDIRLLQHDKTTIREALELILSNETDSKIIEQLKIGLLYLDDFINFTKI